MSNDAAKGFMVLAAKALGIDKELIREMMVEMHYQMDSHTDMEAEQALMVGVEL